MTGQCYHCASDNHGDCQTAGCTCCGAKWTTHLAYVADLVQAMRQFLAQQAPAR